MGRRGGGGSNGGGRAGNVQGNQNNQANKTKPKRKDEMAGVSVRRVVCYFSKIYSSISVVVLSYQILDSPKHED